jgi:hypothetical protein
MKNIIRTKMAIDAFKESHPGLGFFIWAKSFWEFELWRAGKMIDHWVDHNLCTNEGIDYYLDVAFSGGTAITSWYVALFEDNHSPAAGDTYAVPGYTECTAYDEANRPGWQEAGVSSQIITNSANKASFTIYGASLVGGGSTPATKGDSVGGGTLFGSAQFASGSKSVVDDDILKVTVSITGSDV